MVGAEGAFGWLAYAAAREGVVIIAEEVAGRSDNADLSVLKFDRWCGDG